MSEIDSELQELKVETIWKIIRLECRIANCAGQLATALDIPENPEFRANPRISANIARKSGFFGMSRAVANYPVHFRI